MITDYTMLVTKATFILLLSLVTPAELADNAEVLNKTDSKNDGWNVTTSKSCIPHAIDQFPKDLLDDNVRERGGVLIHIFATMYIFGCLAYLCDSYFVPALETFTERMQLKPEVAGASLMAIGNSSPELFTSLIGVYISEDDVGVGTVVGSAVFNILFVIGSCILVSPKVLNVQVYPVIRDASFYILSLIPLAIFCLDGKVDWYDALSLVFLYGVYMLIIYNSEKIEQVFYNHFPCAKAEEDSKEDGPIELMNEPYVTTDLLKNGIAAKESNASHPKTGNPLHNEVDYLQDDDESSVSGRFSCQMPEGRLRKAAFIIGLPVILLFWITIPDASQRKWQKWFPLTFLMCVIYMGSFSYLLVYLVTVIGYTFGVPDIVMGLVFIAFGCNPDAIATIIIAKHGKGRMSISNCIGANIFHILLSLGLPWLTRTLITHHGKSVAIVSGSIKFTIFMLIGSVVSMLCIFFISRWRLRWPAGLTLILAYIILITVACLFEMNMLGRFNLPQCH